MYPLYAECPTSVLPPGLFGFADVFVLTDTPLIYNIFDVLGVVVLVYTA